MEVDAFAIARVVFESRARATPERRIGRVVHLPSARGQGYEIHHHACLGVLRAEGVLDGPLERPAQAGVDGGIALHAAGFSHGIGGHGMAVRFGVVSGIASQEAVVSLLANQPAERAADAVIARLDHKPPRSAGG